MPPLDVDLCVDHHGKAYVPFKYFVRPSTLPSSTTTRSFTCFLQLPTELQLHIYSVCDGATLFNLMHTCSSTRIEASKQFWAHENTWYSCKDDSIFSERNKHPVCFHCPDFGSRIMQVEINMIRIEMYFDAGERESGGNTAQKAQAFWTRVRKIFPSVQTVVLAGLKPNEGFPLVKEDSWRNAASIIQVAVQQAPPDINVFIALQHDIMFPKDSLATCNLWRVTGPSWHLLDGSWTPRRILLPERRYPKYPLGSMLQMISSFHSSCLEQWGMQKLRQESYTRYLPTGSSLPCVSPNCDLRFPNEEEWEKHFFHTSHHQPDFEKDAQEPWRFCEYTPPDIEGALQARYKRLIKQRRDMGKLSAEMVQAWNQPGTEERRVFEEAFFEQLGEVNVAPGECPEGKECQWVHTLHMWLDPECDQ